jgi:hypothetical protein
MPSSGGIPEEARSALAAEPAPSPAVAVGTLDPAQAAALEQHETLPPHGRRREDVSAPAPALDAVAEHDVAERSPQLVADRPAEATSRCSRAVGHGRSHRSAPTRREGDRHEPVRALTATPVPLSPKELVLVPVPLLLGVALPASARLAASSLGDYRRHLQRGLRVFVDHHNTHRPHRALNLKPPSPPAPKLRAMHSPTAAIERRDRLGGLVHSPYSTTRLPRLL